MKYSYRAVERIPSDLTPGVVYHTDEFELAALLCACGCGHKITLLVPDSHQVWSKGGLATVRPSIGVFDAPCKSHFIVSAGRIDWLPPFTGAQASSIMRAQIARHVGNDPRPASWGQRFFDVCRWLRSNLAAFWRR